MTTDGQYMNSVLDQAQEKIAAQVETPPVIETQTTDEQHEDIKVKEVLDEKPQAKRPTIKDMAKKALKAEAGKTPEPEEQITEPLAEAEIESEEAEDESLSAEPIKPPAFWSAERKKLFEKAPRELQEVISQRELELQQQISRAASKGSTQDYEKRFYEDFSDPKELAFHKAKLSAEGINDPIAELHRYRKWDKVIELDPHTAISHLMRKNNFTPHDFLGNEANEVNREPNQYQDPRVDDAIKRAEAAENRIKEWEAQQETARKVQWINSFKEGVDSEGQKRKDFCELYSFQINSEYEKTKAQYPQATEEEALNHAYETVKEGVKAFHGLNQPKAPVKPVVTQEQRIANAKKAQAAASNSVGGPNTGTVSQKPRLKGKNFSEKFDSAFEIAMQRQAAN